MLPESEIEIEHETEADLESRYLETLKMVGDDPSFEALSYRLSVFSPFEALGVADYEIRHGNFLAYLFNPLGAHGFGDAVLQAFLKQLFLRESDATKLAHLVINGVGQTLVRREWHDIDIVVELNDPKLKTVIAIEFKVHAKETSGQLQKYSDFIEGRAEYRDYKKIFVFMTPEGTASSHDDWRDFNMTAGFVQSLGQIASNKHGNEMARMMLADYVRIMEQKFMTEKELEELAEALWARYPDVLGFLADNRPDIVSKVFDRIQEVRSDKLYQRLEEIGFDFFGSGEWDYESNSRLIFSFSNWDDCSGMLEGSDKRLASTRRLMWLEIIKSTDGVRAIFVIGPGNAEARKALLKSLIDGGADTGWQKSTEKMSPEYSTLGSVWLFNNRTREHSLEDAQSLSEKGLETLADFLVDQLPRIDRAVRTLG